MCIHKIRRKGHISYLYLPTSPPPLLPVYWRWCEGLETLASNVHHVYYLTHANVWSQWGSLAAACSLKMLYFSIQVMRESVSGTTSHVAASEHAMKSKVCMINHHHSTKLYRKKYHLFCCCWHCYSCCTLVTIQTATNS